MKTSKIQKVRLVAIAYTKINFEGQELWRAVGERYATLESLNDNEITAELAISGLQPRLSEILKLAFEQAEGQSK